VIDGESQLIDGVVDRIFFRRSGELMDDFARRRIEDEDEIAAIRTRHHLTVGR